MGQESMEGKKMSIVSDKIENASESNLVREVGFFEMRVKLPSLNEWQRMHWAKRKRFKDELRIEVLAHSRRKNIMPADMPRSVRIVRYSAGTLDRDNLVGGCKPLVDALVRNRLLVDDSPEWCDVSYIQEKVGRGGAFCTVALFEEKN